MSLSTLFGDIADAIREKDGTTAPIVANDFPERIQEIETGHMVSLSTNPPGAGTVSGGGRASTGMTVVVNAQDDLSNGYQFRAWMENGKDLTASKTYNVTVQTNRDLVADMHVYDMWFLQSALPSNSRWVSIAFGNGKFVAVSGGSGVNSNVSAYSTDGVNWTQTTLPSSSKWVSVTFGNGRFVAIASNSYYTAYSDDGINWTQSNALAASVPLNSITYGGFRFIVVGSYNKVLLSSDGMSWTEAALPSNRTWASVAFGNGKFVAVSGGSSSSSNIAAYSTDFGTTWTQTDTLPSSAKWVSVTFGNGKFVAIAGSSSNIAAYSTDGINWTQTILPSRAYWSSVTFGNGKFVAIAGSSSNYTAYSVERSGG